MTGPSVERSCTTGAWGPHAFHHNCSRPVVRTNLEPIEGPRAERPVFDRLVLHHYATKSLEVGWEGACSRGVHPPWLQFVWRPVLLLSLLPASQPLCGCSSLHANSA